MILTAEILEAFGLFLTRTSALVLAAPLLGFGTGFSGHKIALIFLLSLVLYTASGQPLGVEVDAIAYGVMMMREVLIGAFLGFIFRLVLLAVRVAGEMISQEMGFMVARQVDPAGGVPSTLITNFYENFFLLAVLLLNGHHWFIRSLESSFQRAPIGHVTLGEGVAPTVLRMFTEMFSAGIVFAAPVMVFLGIVSLLIGLLSRAVPTLNVLELGFTMRVVVSLVAMFLFAPLLEPAMTNLHGEFVAWLEVGLQGIEGG